MKKLFLLTILSLCWVFSFSLENCGDSGYGCAFDTEHGECFTSNTASTPRYGACVCNPDYGTHPDKFPDEMCTYKRKKQWIAFVLEAVVAFGAGHFYSENYRMAIPKLIFWIIGWVLFLTMRIISMRREKTDELALIYASLSLLFTTGMIIWYAVDVIMIGLNRYEDGNGVSLYSWN